MRTNFSIHAHCSNEKVNVTPNVVISSVTFTALTASALFCCILEHNNCISPMY